MTKNFVEFHNHFLLLTMIKIDVFPLVLWFYCDMRPFDTYRDASRANRWIMDDETAIFYASPWFERKYVSIVLFIVSIRSCWSVFQLHSFFSCAFAIFFFFWNTPLGLLVAISFGYFLWSNAAVTDEKKNCWKCGCEFLVCVEKQEGPHRIRQQHEQWVCQVFSSSWELRFESRHMMEIQTRGDATGDKLGVGWLIIGSGSSNF